VENTRPDHVSPEGAVWKARPRPRLVNSTVAAFAAKGNRRISGSSAVSPEYVFLTIRDAFWGSRSPLNKRRPQDALRERDDSDGCGLPACGWLARTNGTMLFFFLVGGFAAIVNCGEMDLRAVD